MTVKIEVELKEVLGKIDTKLDSIQKDITELKIGQAELKSSNIELKTGQKTLVDDVSTLKQDVADLKGTKSLIVPIVVAVTTSLVTLLIRSIPLS